MIREVAHHLKMLIDTSDEMLQNDSNSPDNALFQERLRNANLDHLIADGRRRADPYYNDRPEPSTSRRRDRTPLRQHATSYYREEEGRSRYLSPEEKAEKIVRQAESAKNRMLEVPGMESLCIRGNAATGGHNNVNLLHSVIVDEDFSVVDAHIDDCTRHKIENTQYVDFARLLPSDKILQEENPALRLVSRNGELGVVTAADKDLGVINSYSMWNQAFCVFTNIYTSRFPYKAVELTQYNHVIRTAASTYKWSNVYRYDIDFRIHMSRNPLRSWSVILQLSWSLRLKEKLRLDEHRDDRYGNGDRGKTRQDICWRYNRGRCTYGNSCKFDHKCSVCLKFGHGAHNCRRASGEYGRSERNDRNDRDGRKDYYMAPRQERNGGGNHRSNGYGQNGNSDRRK